MLAEQTVEIARWHRLLPAALAVSARRIRVDPLHALQQVARVRPLDVGFVRSAAVAILSLRRRRHGPGDSLFRAKDHFSISLPPSRNRETVEYTRFVPGSSDMS